MTSLTAAAPDYLSLESPSPTPSEHEQILKMREQLGGNNGDLLSPYIEYDEIISDWAFLRYLRGRDHDVEDSVRVFKEHLILRKDLGLDAIREKVISTRDNYDATDFEDGIECVKSMPLTYNAGRDPNGHVLCYIPIGEQDTYTLEKGVGFDRYRNFCLHEWIARDIQLTRLCIKHNKLISIFFIDNNNFGVFI